MHFSEFQISLKMCNKDLTMLKMIYKFQQYLKEAKCIIRLPDTNYMLKNMIRN